MMDRDKFWAADDDEAVLAEYLAEHSYYGAFDPAGQRFTVLFGDPSRVPALPTAQASTCVFCGTAVALHGDAGWRHEVSLRARGGCTMACPRPD